MGKIRARRSGIVGALGCQPGHLHANGHGKCTLHRRAGRRRWRWPSTRLQKCSRPQMDLSAALDETARVLCQRGQKTPVSARIEGTAAELNEGAEGFTYLVHIREESIRHLIGIFGILALEPENML
ncbi:unnamed protein product [Heligmosomoides polygyrus]|uniref:Cystatin domain-containing protein n=1 Tax=Heligmosomoides polygyrus TaxID=6339 RepID=A0A183GVQ8_HELPZ|nr:unnamed protein product [Heligmosomoides polygyrus]